MSVCGTVLVYLKLSGFSWKLGISDFGANGAPSSCLDVDPPDLPKGSAYALKPGRPTPGSPNLLRPHIAVNKSTGILTRFPSATHLCLTLGADSPCADERCAGNLGFSARGLFTPFIATHVSIRTSDISSIPHRTPSQTYRTLLYRQETEDRGLQTGCTQAGCPHLAWRPLSIFAMSRYVFCQSTPVSLAIYPRSIQYWHHNRASSAEPSAIRR